MVFRRSAVATAVFLALFTHSASAQGVCEDQDDDYACIVNSDNSGCTCQNQLCGACDGCNDKKGGTPCHIAGRADCDCWDGICGNCAPVCNSAADCEPGWFCVLDEYNVKSCQVCADGSDTCNDPHLKGLRGQTIDWSGVDGGWYSLVKDDAADIQVNLRVTAPLPVEFPERQLITGLSVLSAGHSLVIEVKNPYAVDPAACPEGVSPCLANGGIRAVVDGVQQDGLLRSLRKETVAEGMAVSASNLPVECRQFGGAKIWARLYEEMLQGRRELAVEDVFEDWVLSFHTMAAPDWCTRFIDQHSLEDVQSVHAVFKIETPWNTVRLNVGTNQQGDGELNWDGRVLPDLEFWQMDVGMDGLSLENKSLSGLLGETARPVIGADGHPVMEGDGAFRGTIEDYRVDGPLGTDFALLHQ